MSRRRLDVELAGRGLARSREHARQLIRSGAVTVEGHVVTRPAHPVSRDDRIQVDAGVDYVSRAGHKLAGALDELAFDPGGRDALDVGASTGGFTDVLLRRGAARVICLDVGHGQLSPRIAAHAGVTEMSGRNVRDLQPQDLPFAPDLIVGDVSFISLTLVIPALVRCAHPGADLLLLVKPQFEVGRAGLGSGGVVRDPAARARAVESVAAAAWREGLGVKGLVTSRLPGPSGNVEFMIHLREDAPPLPPGLAPSVAGVPDA